MDFPLVSVPSWLATAVPVFFSQEQHRLVAALGLILGIVAGFSHLLPPLVDGKKTEVNRTFIISGLAILIIGLLIAVFGGYALLLLIVAMILLGLFWLVSYVRHFF